MGYQKTFKALIILLLFVGFTANCVLAEVCFCGQFCLHDLQPKAKERADFPFHMRCPDALCEGCDMEEGQTVKGSRPSITSIDLKIISATFLISTTFDYQFFSSILIFSGLLFICGKLPSSPLYLQKLSLRF